jgi:hypothetical protein
MRAHAPHQPNVRMLRACLLACRRRSVVRTRWILAVEVASQSMFLFQKKGFVSNPYAPGSFVQSARYLISTSMFGTGQTANSNQTPLGLHRVAQKIGGGHPIGTVFRGRQPIGSTWQGLPNATIVHRILWLEGLEPGFNRGGNADTFRRYIYIHGFSDESTLGRPYSHGCIHIAAGDLLPLYDRLPIGTLVWIGQA